jgi:hypothetical protein
VATTELDVFVSRRLCCIYCLLLHDLDAPSILPRLPSVS